MDIYGGHYSVHHNCHVENVPRKEISIACTHKNYELKLKKNSTNPHVPPSPPTWRPHLPSTPLPALTQTRAVSRKSDTGASSPNPVPLQHRLPTRFPRNTDRQRQLQEVEQEQLRVVTEQLPGPSVGVASGLSEAGRSGLQLLAPPTSSAASP